MNGSRKGQQSTKTHKIGQKSDDWFDEWIPKRPNIHKNAQKYTTYVKHPKMNSMNGSWKGNKSTKTQKNTQNWSNIRRWIRWMDPEKAKHPQKHTKMHKIDQTSDDEFDEWIPERQQIHKNAQQYTKHVKHPNINSMNGSRKGQQSAKMHGNTQHMSKIRKWIRLEDPEKANNPQNTFPKKGFPDGRAARLKTGLGS